MYDKNRSGTVSSAVLAALAIGMSLIVPHVPGCTEVCSRESAQMVVRGIVVDAGTLEGLPQAYVNVETITQGQETSRGLATIRVQDDPPSTGHSGAFEVRMGFREGMVLICPDAPPPTIPEFPRPDQINVVIVRALCRFEFTIDMNKETVVDLDFPDGVIELIDPILVPECEDPDGSE